MQYSDFLIVAEHVLYNRGRYGGELSVSAVWEKRGLRTVADKKTSV